MEQSNLEISKRRYYDFLMNQYHKGILSHDKIELLKREGIIKEDVQDTYKRTLKNLKQAMNIKEYLDPYKDVFKIYEKDIKRSDWISDDVLRHSNEFVSWINSMVYGIFPHKIRYKPFDLYKKQAYIWLQDKDSITDYKSPESKRAYALREWNRIIENTLYFAEKYGELKEGDIESGVVKYSAKEHHAVIFYLFDCGYNVIGGKGRQIGFTSAMGLCALKKLLVQVNYYIKFITEDQDTGEEIFEDKIKYPFGALPKWLQPPVKSDAGRRFWLSDKPRKGHKGYPNSRIDVIAPKKTAINGGSPQLVLIDEIGNIGILTAMLNEGRPTMFWNDPKTGEFKLKRQVWMWGCLTAGNKVYTKDGRVVNIEDLKQEDGIVGYDGNGAYKEDINWVKIPTKKECYRIETTGGNFIECSYDHPILVSHRDLRSNGKKMVMFKEAKDIKEGDYLMKVNEVPIFGNKKIKYARLLGLLVGDGNYTGRATNLYVSNDEIAFYIENNFDVVKKKRVKNNCKEYYIKNFTKTLKKHGIAGQNCFTKTLPIDIHTFDKESLAEFIGGLFDSDGNVNYNEKKNTVRIVFTSCQRELLEQVKYQLLKFGIGSAIYKENRKSDDTSYGKSKEVYRLYITRYKDVIKFRESIKLLCKYKLDVLDQALNLVKSRTWTGDKYGCEYIENKDCYEDGSYFIGKKMNGLEHERVVKVKYIGEQYVYNINASETHTYLGNGFVTHNTGGEMERGRGAYEKEWYRILNLWEIKKYENGFVPLFFSWHCRLSPEEYEKEKAWYYGARVHQEKDIDLETSKIQFHQHYPTTFTDMFLSTSSTLVDRTIIEDGIERCRSLGPNLEPVYGYFEPVYDYSDPMPPESDVPYRIIDANFVPVDETDVTHKASAIMFQKPEVGWLHRYWQGTDPIATETGHSKMASVIWDDHLKTIPCLINYRKQHDHKHVYLQCLLMGLYYDTGNKKEGVKELVEANIGTNYIDYKESKGFFHTLVFNSQLPDKVTGGTREIGIDNKGNRANAIIDYMAEFFRSYHKRIYVRVVFDQLSTFVEDVTKSGREVWGPVNKLMHFDDVLFACVYAYICRLSFPSLYPTKIEYSPTSYKLRYKLVRDSNYNLKRIPVKIMGIGKVKKEIYDEDENI